MMDSDVSKLTAESTRTGTDEFTSRSHDIFAGLGELEKKHSAFLKVLSSKGSMEDQGLTKLDPDESGEESGRPEHNKVCSQLGDTKGSDFAGQTFKQPRGPGKAHSNSQNSHAPSSTFKRPQRRPFYKHGRQGVPDFRKHPEKYTRYSLGDVSERDMSDRSNAQAAFAFLEERRLQREKEERAAAGVPEEEKTFDTDLAACSQGQIAFSKPPQNRTTDSKHQGKGEKSQIPSSKTSSLLSSYEDEELLKGGAESFKPRNVDTEDLNDSTSTKSEDSKTSVSSSFKSRKTNSKKRNHIRKKTDSDNDHSD